MKRIILSVILLVTAITVNSIMPITAQATPTINIGDYLVMGSYYDEPILWRCVDIDENGPLMLSDKANKLKAFNIFMSKGDY